MRQSITDGIFRALGWKDPNPTFTQYVVPPPLPTELRPGLLTIREGAVELRLNVMVLMEAVKLANPPPVLETGPHRYWRLDDFKRALEERTRYRSSRLREHTNR